MCVYCFKDGYYYFYRRRRRVCGICVLMFPLLYHIQQKKISTRFGFWILERNTEHDHKNWPCVDPETLSREKKE